MGSLRVIGLAVLGLLMSAGLGLADPKFPPLTGRVVDEAALLSPEAERKLTGELAELEQKTGRQLVVVTLPDLQGYPIEDFGYQLGRAWGIGDKDRDDGVLLIVAPRERAVRIEVGYGLEPVLTDALSSLIIQRAILPEFKAGRMEAGVVAGTEALVRQLSLPDEEARAAAARPAAERSGSGGSIGIPTIFVVLIVVWLVAGVLGAFSPRRRRRSAWWLLPLLLSNSSRGGGGGFGGGGWGGGGSGGWSGGGGGSFGGGGASGSW